MKIKLLVTSLVLGLSSAAFAAPAAPAAPVAAAPAFARYHQRWTTLGSATRLSGKDQIKVWSGASYSRLKLEAASGSTFVDKVVVTFGNGQQQVIDRNHQLTARDPMMIDLDGSLRKISKVVVYGKGGRRSSITVLAA